MKRKIRCSFLNNVILLFALMQLNNIYPQKNIESVSDDWKQQTANYVIIGYTSNNPNVDKPQPNRDFLHL